MEHKLPPLPFERSALAPAISSETLDYHYSKHHNTYVTNLNKLIAGTKFEKMPLEEIITSSEGSVFNNAAQHYNHTFYWNCLMASGDKSPTGKLADAVKRDFESFPQFKDRFTSAAVSLFGSGWVWLAADGQGGLSIESLSNAGNPLTIGKKPILVCDVWEHAYYIDYRNLRAEYLKSFWTLANWKFAEMNYER